MKRSLLLRVFVVAALVSPASVSNAGDANNTEISTLIPGQLTVCTYTGFAPVSYTSPGGQVVGLDVSFLTRFAESLGLRIATRHAQFDGIWRMPGHDACDVAGAGVMKRDDRPPGPGGSWSDAYFQVNRSLVVRAADKAAFDDYSHLAGKTIVVTRGSTAEKDAEARYPNCKIEYVDEVVPPDAKMDAQRYVVRELIAKHKADAFGEGDVSNNYLRDRYSGDVDGGLAVADVHPIAGAIETFNFTTRNASVGIGKRLDAFIAQNKAIYLPAQTGEAPEPAATLRIDIPITLTEAKVVYNMDRAAYSGDLPLGLRFLRLQVDSFKQTGVKAQLIAVVHAQMGYIVLNDATYNRVRQVTTGNPYRELIAQLITDGVRFEATSVTMEANGWTNAELLPGVLVNGGGIPRIVQLVQEGFVQIQP